MSEFRILGPLEVLDDRGNAVPLGGPKVRATLAVLLLDAGRVVSTDQLVAALWGERPPRTAATSLHVFISQLRKLIGAETLLRKEPGYLLNVSKGDIDVWRFEQLLDAARKARDPTLQSQSARDALALFRGEPLADFRYEAFAASEITRLNELRLTALEVRLAAEIALGGTGDVIAELEALIPSEPLRERLRELLMLALYRSGRQAEALELYQQSRALLVEELGLEPTRALQELHRRILVQDPTLALDPGAQRSATARLSRTPRFGASRALVGRAVQQREIDALLAAARDGQGGARVLQGEPGIGKTALLQYAQERSTAMAVLRARGVEAEAELPFSGLHELLRPLLHLLHMLPEPQANALRGAFGHGPPVEARLLIGAGALTLLATAAEEQPLLCLIDDAHWLDAASASALAFVARRLDSDPVLLLFAERPEERRAFEPQGIPPLPLDPLSDEEAAELLAELEFPPTVVADVQRSAQGNPLALLELPPLLSDRQRAGTEPLPRPLPLTKTILEAFARQIEALPEATRWGLLVAAAEPSAEIGPVADALSRLAIDRSALAPAEDAGLIGLVEATIVFRHPLVAAAAYHSRPASERRRAHAALAEAVDDDQVRQAWHLAAAAAGVDATAASALEDAARTTYARSGYRSAAVMLERAAALSPDRATRAERLYFAAIMNFYAHEIASALALLVDAEAAAADDDARGRYRLLRLALSYYREPLDAASRLFDEAGETSDPRRATLAAAFSSCLRATLRDSDGALQAAQRTRELAESDDAFAAVAAGLGFAAAGRLEETGSFRDSAAAVFHAREWRYDSPENWEQGYAGVYAGAALVLLGEHQVLRARVDSLAADFVPGDEVALMFARALVGTSDFFAGRWTEARIAVSDSLRIAEEIGWQGPVVCACSRVLAHLAAAQGAAEDARRYDEVGAQIASAEWAGFTAGGAPGLLLLGLGDADAAADHYLHVLPARIGPMFLYHDVADAIEAYLRAERLEDARALLESFTTQARDSGWPWALARASHLAGLAGDDYRAAFDEALRWHELAAQPFLRARTQLAYGSRLLTDGDEREAREHLRAALDAFGVLGATPWVDTTADMLGLERRQEVGISQLTSQELQVALLVAQGASSKDAAARLFSSPRTIDRRLASATAKLGLASVPELVRVVAAAQTRGEAAAPIA